MNLVGVHQELGAIVVDAQREVVRNTLVQALAGGPAECCRQVDALLPEGQIVVVRMQIGHGHGSCSSLRRLSYLGESPVTAQGGH